MIASLLFLPVLPGVGGRCRSSRKRQQKKHSFTCLDPGSAQLCLLSPPLVVYSKLAQERRQSTVIKSQTVIANFTSIYFSTNAVNIISICILNCTFLSLIEIFHSMELPLSGILIAINLLPSWL